MTEHNRDYILELFKIVNTKSILIIDCKGTLKRLQCPFKVVAIAEMPPQITAGASYDVESVKMTLELREVYIIKDKGYYICYFQII